MITILLFIIAITKSIINKNNNEIITLLTIDDYLLERDIDH